ncbi:MAG: 4-hydroxy-tetrahydrodipicolinate synthase, partial [Bartonella sp.]|nr:4-hydroxy-tetrahydrodipicolinate synthase [Bartonella sp.]
HEEHKRVVELCVKQVSKRIPVVAGAGSNSTDEAVELAQHAEKVGADAVLVVTPYYNKPNQKGLYAHFSAIAKAISIPIVIYNIPGRSVIDITVETMKNLCQDFKNIVGVKDATGKIDRVSEQREKCGQNFIQLSGDDRTALGFNAHGGVGCISVVSNVAPKLCSELYIACHRGDYNTALELNDRLMPLNCAIFIEPNPAG